MRLQVCKSTSLNAEASCAALQSQGMASGSSRHAAGQDISLTFNETAEPEVVPGSSSATETPPSQSPVGHFAWYDLARRTSCGRSGPGALNFAKQGLPPRYPLRSKAASCSWSILPKPMQAHQPNAFSQEFSGSRGSTKRRKPL